MAGRRHREHKAAVRHLRTTAADSRNLCTSVAVRDMAASPRLRPASSRSMAMHGNPKSTPRMPGSPRDGGAKRFRFTAPPYLGAAKITPIVEDLYNAARDSLIPGPSETPDQAVQAFADTLPEYVLGPQNPLSFLTLRCRARSFRASPTMGRSDATSASTITAPTIGRRADEFCHRDRTVRET
jgi:hypothetical protein